MLATPPLPAIRRDLSNDSVAQPRRTYTMVPPKSEVQLNRIPQFN